MAEWIEGKWVCAAMAKTSATGICMRPPVEGRTRCKFHGAYAGRKKKDGSNPSSRPEGYKNSIERGTDKPWLRKGYVKPEETDGKLPE